MTTQQLELQLLRSSYLTTVITCKLSLKCNLHHQWISSSTFIIYNIIIIFLIITLYICTRFTTVFFWKFCVFYKGSHKCIVFGCPARLVLMFVLLHWLMCYEQINDWLIDWLLLFYQILIAWHAGIFQSGASEEQNTNNVANRPKRDIFDVNRARVRRDCEKRFDPFNFGSSDRFSHGFGKRHISNSAAAASVDLLFFFLNLTVMKTRPKTKTSFKQQQECITEKNSSVATRIFVINKITWC